MSESHHHHHQHKMDGASQFKRKQLQAIKRRKAIAKWGFRALVIVAILMAIATIIVYRTK